MNYLAWGGKMARACRVCFKTTPIGMDITFRPRVYVYPTPRPEVPLVSVTETSYGRLYTGNIVVESGIHGRLPKIKNITSF